MVREEQTQQHQDVHRCLGGCGETVPCVVRAAVVPPARLRGPLLCSTMTKCLCLYEDDHLASMRILRAAAAVLQPLLLLLLLLLAPAAAHRRTSPLPMSVLAPAAHPRASGVRAAMRGWRDITRAAAGDPVVRPIDYGADPTGRVDSTDAFAAAVGACLARNTSGHVLSFGVADLGGVTLDLGGGDYLVSSPVVFPAGFGNYRIIDGSLRASAGFPSDRFMVEFGTGSCTNPQGAGPPVVRSACRRRMCSCCVICLFAAV